MERLTKVGTAAGFIAGIAASVVMSFPWFWVGFKTYVWGDGCPDIYRIAPLWWRTVFFLIVTPALLSLCIYTGLQVRRLILTMSRKNAQPDASAKRGDSL